MNKTDKYIGLDVHQDTIMVAIAESGRDGEVRLYGRGRPASPTPIPKRGASLEADEFMRRYLQHVLPPGLHRVRYFGWLHPAARARRLKVETFLAVLIVVCAKADRLPPWHLRCPHCQTFTLVWIGRFARAPPSFNR